MIQLSPTERFSIGFLGEEHFKSFTMTRATSKKCASIHPTLRFIKLPVMLLGVVVCAQAVLECLALFVALKNFSMWHVRTMVAGSAIAGTIAGLMFPHAYTIWKVWMLGDALFQIKLR